jgi:hypothetical protein
LTTAAAIFGALESDNNESLDLDDDELELLSSAANVGREPRRRKTKSPILSINGSQQFMIMVGTFCAIS